MSRFDVYSNDSASQIAMLAGGLGIGQTHRLVVSRMLQAGPLVPVLEAWGGHPAPISVLYPSSAQMNRRAKVFGAWLDRYLKHVDA